VNLQPLQKRKKKKGEKLILTRVHLFWLGASAFLFSPSMITAAFSFFPHFYNLPLEMLHKTK
jgi:hypothetical protein